MLLVDDLLAAPFRGLLFLFGEIARAVAAEREERQREAVASLAELHRRFEAGLIGAEEFDALEAALLDRLQQ